MATGYSLKPLQVIELSDKRVLVSLSLSSDNITIENFDIRGLSIVNTISDLTVNFIQTQLGFISSNSVQGSKYYYSAASILGAVTDQTGFVNIEIEQPSKFLKDIVINVDQILINDTSVNIPELTIELNDSPVFSSTSSPSVDENQTSILTLTASDDENDNIVFSITGGENSASFNLTDGVLSFKAAPNYEVKSSYSLMVTATETTTENGESIADPNTTEQEITVTVNDVNEAPVITSSSSIETPEQDIEVSTVVVTDAESDAITYGLSGTDAALFSISTSGLLTFIVAPDYEGDAPVHGSPHSNEYN
ncbi:MAG TPA: cadherin repeat domain-containing protein, partial [Candidatus Thioglobus autotrophicus]|nr:cadherin repeat domain-containing protein [Candidatus Thioglobus autotrophicus]